MPNSSWSGSWVIQTFNRVGPYEFGAPSIELPETLPKAISESPSLFYKMGGTEWLFVSEKKEGPFGCKSYRVVFNDTLEVARATFIQPKKIKIQVADEIHALDWSGFPAWIRAKDPGLFSFAPESIQEHQFKNGFASPLLGISFGKNWISVHSSDDFRWLESNESQKTSANETTPAGMKTNQYLKTLHAAQKALKLNRSCWTPVLLPKGKSSKALSQWGGSPVMAEGETTLNCKQCGAVLSLVIQLDLAKIPLALRSKSDDGRIFQFLACANIECEGEMSEESGSRIARVITKENLHFPKTPLKSRKISGWKKCKDPEFPTAADPAWDHVQEWLKNSETRHAFELRNWDRQPLAKDKIGGWPHWIQDGVHAFCTRCKNSQHCRFFFQIASQQSIDWAWGDCGIAYVFRCEKHPEQFQSFWQST